MPKWYWIVGLILAVLMGAYNAANRWLSDREENAVGSILETPERAGETRRYLEAS